MNFDDTVRACLPVMRRVALRYTKSPADADDIVQDALVKAMAAWAKFDPAKGRAHAWLCVIVKHCFISEMRKRSNRPTVIAEQDEGFAAWAHYLDAQRAIARLSTEHRQVLELAMVGTEYRAMAEQLGWPIGTVMSRLHRARTAMEGML